MSTAVAHAASRAIAELVDALADAGIEATRDAGAFYPQPTGVLVGLPTLTRRLHGSRVFTVPVLVVSADPLNRPLAVDRLYAIADDVALVLRVDTYRPSEYRAGPNAEPVPALELVATVTVTESEGT